MTKEESGWYYVCTIRAKCFWAKKQGTCAIDCSCCACAVLVHSSKWWRCRRLNFYGGAEGCLLLFALFVHYTECVILYINFFVLQSRKPCVDHKKHLEYGSLIHISPMAHLTVQRGHPKYRACLNFGVQKIDCWLYVKTSCLCFGSFACLWMKEGCWSIANGGEAIHAKIWRTKCNQVRQLHQIWAENFS